MSDLAALFASPPGPAPRRSPPPASPPTPSAPARSSPSRKNPLFFSPGSAIDSPRRVRPIPQRARSPIFAPEGYGQPSPPMDPQEIDDILASNGRRSPAAAETRPRNGDFEEYLDPFAGLRGGNGDEEGEVKKRRVVAKVDGDRLTGDMGILKLMKAAKKFKVKGKGREGEDLRDLLHVYQLWAHGMFPKGDFVGTMSRVEVVCRTRRMESAMKGYRDAFYPRPRTPTPPPPAGSLPTTPQTPPNRYQPHRAGSGEADGSPDATAGFVNGNTGPDGQSGSRSQPLFEGDDELELADIAHPRTDAERVQDDENGPDWDELMAMEEMDAVPAARADAAGVKSRPDEQDEFDGLYD